MAIGIIIVEDHEIYRYGLKTLLATHSEVALLGEAATAEEALELVRYHRPDLVLMDVRLPGMSGIEATKKIVEVSPETRVLILTMFDDDPSVFAAMQAGARGYMLKGAKHGELLRAIEAVAGGEALFSASIAERMMQYFAKPVPGRGRVFSELTEREHEVLALLVQSLSTGEIARRLEVRPKTVRNYISNIVSKLQVSGRMEAVEQARHRGM